MPAPIIIIGAMIGAGIGGGIAMSQDKPIWQGALLGAVGGGLGGWGLGAATGVGMGSVMGGAAADMSTIGAAGAMSGSAAGAGSSIGAATPALASAPMYMGASVPGSLAPGVSTGLSQGTFAGAPGASLGAGTAPSVTSALGAASSAPAAAAGGLTASNVIQAGLGLAGPLLNTALSPSMPEPQAPIAPALITPPQTQQVKHIPTPAEIDARNARARDSYARFAGDITDEEQQKALALLSLQRSYTDPYARARATTSSQQRQSGPLRPPGGFRFASL